MERGCHSSGDGGGGDSSSAAAAYLKHLNKISHKISKPIRKPPVYENHSVLSSQLAQQTEAAAATMAAPPQQQPPVYNINKSDFRDVVQKLTGSPAHERMMSTPPPPIHQPKPPSSRLQRIRPPPLAQVSNRPSPLLTYAGHPGGPRTQPPLSPLPPFPAVHAAAESPISAYMRFLHTSFTASAVASPRWNTFAPLPPSQQKQNPLIPPPQPQQNPLFPPPQPQQNPSILPQFPTMPSSPLPFSCLPSPRSPCALLSPNLLLSPAGQLGFPQFPLSPTVPIPSPTWKGI